MTLSEKHIRWSIECIRRHSDGDIFPPLSEMAAASADEQALARALANKPMGAIQPQPSRRFIVPKDDWSYRQATQLHPQDSILLTAAIRQFGQGIESRRLDQNAVFSYRFNPHLRYGLYGVRSLWNEFSSSAYRKSFNYSHILYCDIADFYNQIYHHAVENQLAESGFPNQATKWIMSLLESTTEKMSRGLPIGPHPIHLIAESVLIPIDNSLKLNGIDFIRYADDVLVFCNSAQDMRRALFTIVRTLDGQQRLTLQQHKTKTFTAADFREYSTSMIEDRPISPAEDRILNIVRKYSQGDPYVRTPNKMAC